MAKSKKAGATKKKGATKAKTSRSNGAAHAKGSNGSAPLRQGIERRRYVEQLPVPIDAVKVAAKARELSECVRERESLLEERREAMADFKERSSAIDNRMKSLATSVDKGTELQEVEVIEQLIVETNEIKVVRTDTAEVVSTRPAEAEDRQEGLFGGGGEKDEPVDEDEGETAEDLEDAAP